MMEENGIKPGLVVFSKAGRDSGRDYCILTVVDPDYVLIADGERHKIDRPKRKKLKHLKPTKDILALGSKLEQGVKVFDSELKSALRAYNEN